MIHIYGILENSVLWINIVGWKKGNIFLFFIVDYLCFNMLFQFLGFSFFLNLWFFGAFLLIDEEFLWCRIECRNFLFGIQWFLTLIKQKYFF